MRISKRFMLSIYNAMNKMILEFFAICIVCAEPALPECLHVIGKAWYRKGKSYVSKATDLDSKMADSVQVEEPQRRAVGGTITTGRIHKGIKIHKFMINTPVFTSYRKTET